VKTQAMKQLRLVNKIVHTCIFPTLHKELVDDKFTFCDKKNQKKQLRFAIFCSIYCFTWVCMYMHVNKVEYNVYQKMLFVYLRRSNILHAVLFLLFVLLGWHLLHSYQNRMTEYSLKNWNWEPLNGTPNVKMYNYKQIMTNNYGI